MPARPDDFAAAVVAYEKGRLADAERLLQRPATAGRNRADALHLLGLIALRTGRAAAAEARLRDAVAADGSRPPFHANLGLALKAQGRLDEAAGSLHRALALQPDYAAGLGNLGVVLVELGRAAEARDCLARATAIEPGNATAHFNLADALLALGDVAGAIASLERAVALRPGYSAAHNNLGNLLRRQGRPVDAVASYRRALALDPRLAGAHCNLAATLQETGRLAEAEAAYRAALDLDGAMAEAHAGLAGLRLMQGRIDDAVAGHRRAVALRPEDAEAQNALGYALDESGRHDEAVAAFDSALRLDPSHAVACWRRALSLPVIYDSADAIAEHRARWAEGLRHIADGLRLDTPRRIADAVRAARSMTIFYLHYQGFDDLELQRLYGGLLHRIAAAAHPDAALPPPAAPARARPRIGFVSAYLHQHSVAKSHGAWIAGLDRSRFESCVFHTGWRSDRTTEAIRRAADIFVAGIRPDREWIEIIRGHAPDLLVFLDIGMDPQTQFLAALRLAPVQATSWGHPVTSGLPTVDWYLSSDPMEPAGAEAQYSERLVRLPNLSVSYAMPAVAAARIPAGLPGGGDVLRLVCAQSLFKLLPQHDALWPRIARELPQARFLFIAGQSAHVTERFRARLARVFAAHGLAAEDFCTILPRLPHEEFLGLCRAADLVLDSCHWSGFNSTMEAVAFGKPVVTLPGAAMRGRHGLAILQCLGVEDTIARDPDHYVEIAVALGRDAARRGDLGRRIGQGRARLYDDPAPLRALEDFFERAIRPTPAT